jgi:tRNA (cmo5U34)-methyltransferase
MKSDKDSLYRSKLDEVMPFSFDSAVADVFPDMIERSVPGYQTILSAIGLLAGRFAKPHSSCYDLGCSLGAATFAMRQSIKHKDIKIVAVDNSEAMVERLENSLSLLSDNCINVVQADICDIPISNASVVVLNFTLQFIPPEKRLDLMERIYQGMLPGGVLILSEKISFENERQSVLQIDLHHEFKKNRGYSDLEISQKRAALENVLIPETFKQHQERLISAGFESVEIWFQYFNFASIIALK